MLCFVFCVLLRCVALCCVVLCCVVSCRVVLFCLLGLGSIFGRFGGVLGLFFVVLGGFQWWSYRLAESLKSSHVQIETTLTVVDLFCFFQGQFIYCRIWGQITPSCNKRLSKRLTELRTRAQ